MRYTQRNSPIAPRAGVHPGIDTDALIHGDIGKSLSQQPVVQRPGAQADAVGSFGLAERGRAIQHSPQVAAFGEAILDALHQSAASLVGEAIPPEKDRIMVLERLVEVNLVSQIGNEPLECLD